MLGCVWAGYVGAADCKCTGWIDIFFLKFLKLTPCWEKHLQGGQSHSSAPVALKHPPCLLPPFCSFFQMPFAQSSGLLDPPGIVVDRVFPGCVPVQMRSGQAPFSSFPMPWFCRGRQRSVLKWNTAGFSRFVLLTPPSLTVQVLPQKTSCWVQGNLFLLRVGGSSTSVDVGL